MSRGSGTARRRGWMPLVPRTPATRSSLSGNCHQREIRRKGPEPETNEVRRTNEDSGLSQATSGTGVQPLTVACVVRDLDCLTGRTRVDWRTCVSRTLPKRHHARLFACPPSCVCDVRRTVSGWCIPRTASIQVGITPGRFGLKRPPSSYPRPLAAAP